MDVEHMNPTKGLQKRRGHAKQVIKVANCCKTCKYMYQGEERKSFRMPYTACHLHNVKVDGREWCKHYKSI